ncbi:MAG: rod shape-determining protein MreC [Rhodocyclaceae bacterium]|nr:rod shape-determining protein MreC [Rhodocyclaceae bacterium]MBX3668235.1 rod shape-determining protein MreC [Rhodocyclaceae bacterium]
MSIAGHQPPPFFKRGPAPLVQLVVLVSISLTLLVVDLRLRYLDVLRQVVAVALTPVQVAANSPVDMASALGRYFAQVDALQAENARLKRTEVEAANRLLRQQYLEEENTRLRALLDMRERLHSEGLVADIVYGSRDVFSRRVIIDRGMQDRIAAGSPVVDERGVVGQVTRLYPLQAEVTLITDKDQAIPAQVARTGQRVVLFGAGNGQLEVRFLAANADVQVGDALVTSGLDGVFLPGLPVAQVEAINREGASGFAQIICAPAAAVEARGTVLVLGRRLPELQPAPEAPAEAPKKKGARSRAAQG